MGSADALGVLHESTLTFPDAGGSHAEAIAHLRENGRITAAVVRVRRALGDPADPLPVRAEAKPTGQVACGQGLRR
ncbi:hypothetical protein [Streptomyces sp. NPDC001876]|uniref:hypothetical protein n=1 Tax=Streptomyces sp. NPDC001876 TaxID=3154402 RepID=UPI0033267E32